jgi:acyl-coenzyme A synthetase/AMP-(fatty) acid ligase
LWTGDLAYRDEEGFVFLKGRSKDILKVGGHRVSPLEIEQVVEAHPDVAEAAVIGVADGLMGEVPAAYVVPRPGRRPEPEDLRRFCGERLPTPEVPVRFTLVDALPRSDAGKLLRAELAERQAQDASEGGSLRG